MAEASAAVERREASASRWTRGRARSAIGWQHLIAWRGLTGQLRLFGAPPPLIFLEAKASWLWLAKLGRGCVARTRLLAPSAPAIAGEGGHWSSRSERTVVEGAQDSKLRYRCRMVEENKIESLRAPNDSSSSKSALDPALSKLRCCPRPFHHPAAQGGPPSPLSRGRKKNATARRCGCRGSRHPKV